MPIKPTFTNSKQLSASPQSAGLLYSSLVNDGAGATGLYNLVTELSSPLPSPPPIWGTASDGALLYCSGQTAGGDKIDTFLNVSTYDFTLIAGFVSKATTTKDWCLIENRTLRLAMNYGASSPVANKISCDLELASTTGATWLNKHNTFDAPGINDGLVHRVYIAKSGAVVRFYVDGVLRLTETYGADYSLALDGTLRLFGYGTTVTEGINEFHFYDRALTQAEITQHEATPYAMAKAMGAVVAPPAATPETQFHVLVFRDNAGGLATGATPTFTAFKSLPGGANVSPLPTISALIPGVFSFPYDVNARGQAVALLDGGTGVPGGLSRYQVLPLQYTLPDAEHSSIMQDVVSAFLGANTVETTVTLPPAPNNAGLDQIKDALTLLPGTTAQAMTAMLSLSSGAVAVTLRFRDSVGTPVPYTAFHVVGQGIGKADAGGNALIALDAGTYSVRATAPASSVLFPLVTIPVASGAPVSQTITAQAVILPQPSALPNQCVVFLDLVNPQGVETGTVKIVNLPTATAGRFLVGQKQMVKINQSGRLVFAPLPQGASVSLSVPGANLERTFTIPAVPVYQVI